MPFTATSEAPATPRIFSSPALAITRIDRAPAASARPSRGAVWPQSHMPAWAAVPADTNSTATSVAFTVDPLSVPSDEMPPDGRWLAPALLERKGAAGSSR